MISSLLLFHGSQHHAQTHVALLKVGHGSHDLFVSGIAAELLQLGSQISQFLGMGSVVANHILHQSHQLFHGGMLTLGSAALAGTGAAMIVIMVMIVVVMMVVIVIVMMVAMLMIVVMVMMVVMFVVVMLMHRI